ncbi:hypothetical protein [Paludibacterium yongneupense]|uniref:hypothetical protein n=1 Tax=Paludibacterium yongneupense TaxID=400061 RepID=UPI0004215C17|nr:hypothetical protein [Paludibacterium yongneupense]
MDETCRIIESQLPLLGKLGGHNLLVLLDGAGKVLCELDGLATSRDGRIKPVGYLLSDRLKVYAFARATFHAPTQAHAVLLEGSRTALENRFDAARAAGEAINRRDLPYPLLGLGKNSNSVASTLIRAMALDEPDLPGNARFTPGRGRLLLDQETLAGIQDTFLQRGRRQEPMATAQAG